MIINFKSKISQDIYDGKNSRHARLVSSELHGKIVRIFDQINAATKIETLRVPPGNRLEKLTGNLQEYWSIRINKQWRVIFKWNNGDASDVDIVDYH
jgi:proteic killer suppression protein